MTTTWVALLRGINVGKAKRIAMADLRGLLGGLGYDDVRTHLQSGNALFMADTGTASSIETTIGREIKKALGIDCKVLVRSAGELAEVVEHNPFVARGVAPDQLYATFLSGAPASGRLSAVNREDVAPDEFELGDRVLYTRQPNGVMGTRLPTWDKVLGVDASARSWKTVTRVAELANG